MDWTNLKAAINAAIKNNNNQEITGQVLQNTLNSIVNSIGENATFAGVAKPNTSPGTPDGPVFWIAARKGVYPNFGNINFSADEAQLGIFIWKSGVWDLVTVDIDILSALNKNGAVFAGVARPSGFTPKRTTDRIFYIAYTPGEYTAFNNQTYTLTNKVMAFFSTEVEGVWDVVEWDIPIYKEIVQDVNDGTDNNIPSGRAVKNAINIIPRSNLNYISEPYLTDVNSFVTKEGIISSYNYYNVVRVDCFNAEGKINANVTLRGTNIPIFIAFDKNNKIVSSQMISNATQHNVSFEINSNVSYILFNIYGTVLINYISSFLTVSLKTDDLSFNNAIIASTKQVVNGDAVKFSVKPFNFVLNDGKIKFDKSISDYYYKYTLVEISNFDNSVDFSFKAYFKGSNIPAALILDNNYNIIQTIDLASTDGFTTITCKANTNAAHILVNTIGGINGINSIYKIPGKKANITTNFSKKEISILFIGNSLTQDAISCLPLILKEICPDISFRLICYYNSGRTLKQQYEEFFTTNETCEIFSVSENSISWENREKAAGINEILTNYNFDIVCLQEYSYFSFNESELINNFNNIVNYITTKCNKPLKFITLLDQPNRSKVETMYANAVSIVKTFMKNTICEDVLVPGTVIYEALKTNLTKLGDNGNLSPDGTHAQEGLPCLMQAYVIALWIFKQLGIPKSIYGFNKYITHELYNIINVPGPNLGTGVITGTAEENKLAQEIAIKVFKEYDIKKQQYLE